MNKLEDTPEIVEENVERIVEAMEGAGSTAAATIADAVRSAHECALDNGIDDPREVRGMIIEELNEIIENAKDARRAIKRAIFPEGGR